MAEIKDQRNLVARIEQFYKDLDDALSINVGAGVDTCLAQYQLLLGEAKTLVQQKEAPLAPFENEPNAPLRSIAALKVLVGQLAQWVRYETGFREEVVLILGGPRSGISR